MWNPRPCTLESARFALLDTSLDIFDLRCSNMVLAHGCANGLAFVLLYSTLLELQSHFGDKPVKIQVVCPQNGTPVLIGLIPGSLWFTFHPGCCCAFFILNRSFCPSTSSIQHTQYPCRFFNPLAGDHVK